ncbi:unnamed protein product [Symbiodinium natans]|uniref:Uncharacterized protein n=1 Tax=Symbiodinium natans TaxID=878477 RepID=A0A812S7T4_9DINO|nr:unnamed protein product [Symbiodinium natans]
MMPDWLACDSDAIPALPYVAGEGFKLCLLASSKISHACAVSCPCSGAPAEAMEAEYGVCRAMPAQCARPAPRWSPATTEMPDTPLWQPPGPQWTAAQTAVAKAEVHKVGKGA